MIRNKGKRRKGKQALALLLCISTFASLASTTIVAEANETEVIEEIVVASETEEIEEIVVASEVEVIEEIMVTNEVEVTQVAEMAEQLSKLYEDIALQEDTYTSRTLLVQLTEGGNLLENSLESTRIHMGDGFYVLDFKTEEDALTTYKMLCDDENVLLVEKDAMTSLSSIAVEEQLESSEEEDIYGFQVFIDSLEGNEKKVVIALIDTPVSENSNSVQDSIVVLDNDIGIDQGSGVSSSHAEVLSDLLVNYTTEQVEILPITAFNEEGNGTVLSAYVGILAAIEAGVDVINLSFSGAGESNILKMGIQKAQDAGIVVVAAAGNDGGNVSNYMPGNIEVAITVGALENDEEIASYSNTGSLIDMVASGNYIYQGSVVSGTSVATAYVSAAAALLIQESQEVLTANKVESLLLSRTVDLGSEGKDSIYGYGRLSLYSIVEEEEEELEETPDSEEIIPEDESVDELVDDGNQTLTTAWSTDPTDFWGSSQYGNQGTGVVVYEEYIWWCSRGYLASTSTYRYENLGWYITMTSSSTGQSFMFYILKDNYIYAEEEMSGYSYKLFRMDFSELYSAVVAKGYNATNFFAGTVTVEFNGNIRLYNYNTGSTLSGGGPYNLTYSSNLTTLLYYMNYYSFSSSSLTNAEEMYVDKILSISGSSIVSASSYTISYNSNTTDTVTNMPTAQTKYHGVVLSITSTTPLRTGYTFQEWNSKSDGTGSSWKGVTGSYSTFSGNFNQVLYAIWKADTYTVSYSSNTTDTVTNMPSSQTKTYGVTLNITTTTPVRTGYTFTGWNSSADGSGTWYMGTSGYTYTNNNYSRTLYAQWKVNTYTISYSSNTTDTVTNMPSSQTKTYGVTLNITTTTPVRTGYTFTGWNSSADGSGTWYMGSSGYTYTNTNYDRTLYAQWTKKTYTNDIEVYLTGFLTEHQTNSNGSYQFLREEFTVGYGESFTRTASTYSSILPNGFTLSGYGQTYVEAADGTRTYTYYNFPITMTQGTSIIHLDIMASANEYTITYDLGGGTLAEENPSSYTILYGVTFDNEPVREGYEFLGWFIDGELVTGINVGATGSFSSVSELKAALELRQIGNVVVTAEWNKAPELVAEDVYMYLENDLDEERIRADVLALDEEDGDISDQVTFNKDELEVQLQELRQIEVQENTEYELEIYYTVVDSAGAEVTIITTLHIYATVDAVNQEASNGYIRFISADYVDTLEENSIWRESDNWEYLIGVLS